MSFCKLISLKTEERILVEKAAVCLSPSSEERGRTDMPTLIPESFAMRVSRTVAVWLYTSLCCQKYCLP